MVCGLPKFGDCVSRTSCANGRRLTRRSLNEPRSYHGQRKEQGLQTQSWSFIISYQRNKLAKSTSQEYKVPQEKYVVVVNSWGLPERFDNNTKLNEIGVWFELLLRKDYPNARVREIFYQKTVRTT